MRIRHLVPAALLALLASAWAQYPQVPPGILEGPETGRRLTGDTIIFCVDPRDPAHEVDRAIAEAIAGALLLEPEFHVVQRTLVTDTIENLYVDLVNHCHVSLGFKHLSNAYASWLILTRAYYRTSYVLAVSDPSWSSLTDIPRDRPIGGVPGTVGDVRFLTTLRSMGEQRLWPRYPKGSHELALEAVLDGSLGAALVWAPSAWALKRSSARFDELRLVYDDRISEPIGVGAVLLDGNAFLRSRIDDAIAALSAYGTIEEILASHDFPAQPPPAE